MDSQKYVIPQNRSSVPKPWDKHSIEKKQINTNQVPPQKPWEKQQSLYVKMSDLSKLDDLVQEGDFIVFDIDKTLLNTGSAKYTDEVITLCPVIPQMIKKWLVSNISVIILTARKYGSEERTIIQLSEIGITQIQVVHAPPQNGNPTKGIVLKSHLDSLETQPKRVVTVDDMLSNHQNIKLNITLPMLQILKTPNKMFEYSEHTFPENIMFLCCVEDNDNVCIYNNNNKQYTMTIPLDVNQTKMEILSSALYKRLGFAIPDFAVYDHFPSNLKKKKHIAGPFKLSLYTDFPVDETLKYEIREWLTFAVIVKQKPEFTNQIEKIISMKLHFFDTFDLVDSKIGIKDSDMLKKDLAELFSQLEA